MTSLLRFMSPSELLTHQRWDESLYVVFSFVLDMTISDPLDTIEDQIEAT